ncbi:MAG TPA: peptidoglycan-binding domain-containing protein [Edaphobacter sp.]|nr:peptidoglycan-binding domain-containing protein [Edaphobacter sp.]
MRLGRLLSSVLVLATVVTPCVAKVHKHHTSAKQSKVAAKHTGQRSIDDARATEIQQALVRSGYLTDVSGHWDSATEAAMQKYQSDNGWQTKLMPDSRAIIKLGLGPNQTTSNTTADLSSTAQSTVAESYTQTNDLAQR